MGLIDDLSYKRLEYINYFRNHASSAHPNEHELSGVELLGFLENCLRYAICTEPDVPAIQVKRLRENVRTQVIEPEDYETINDEICKLPLERIEDLLRTFFGMYCDPKQDQTALANIKGLAPYIWKVVGEDLKLKIGSKFGAYRANGDTERKARANDFLGAVGGNSYKDEDSLSSELIEKLQELRVAHNSTNNFYNEYSYALSIKQSLPKSGIPNAAKKDFVKVVSVCYMGNGCGYREGVDERAVVLYSEFIERFTNKEIRIFLGLFNDPEFLRDMHSRKVKQRAKSLAELLESKTSDVRIKNALRILLKSNALEKVGMVSEYKNAINGIA